MRTQIHDRLGAHMRHDEIELDALRVFSAVVEAGSFSAAAKQLGRAQSAVSYIVRELEAKLGSSLFDRSGYRPRLSDAGQLLLPRIGRLLQDAAVLRAAADALAGGVEPEVTLVIDSLYPMASLAAPLTGFSTQYSHVRLRVLVEPLGAAASAVHEGEADLGILVALADRFEELEPHSTLIVELVPVAAPRHPLAQAQRRAQSPLDVRLAREHLQLVLTDRSDRTAGYDKGVHASHTWRLADLSLKYTLLLGGVGWGSLPRHLVADDLSDGRLVELTLSGWDGYDAPPHLRAAVVHKRGRSLGPAATWLRHALSRVGDEADRDVST